MKKTIQLLLLLLLTQTNVLFAQTTSAGSGSSTAQLLSVELRVSSKGNVSCQSGRLGYVTLQAIPSDSNDEFSKDGINWQNIGYFPNLKADNYTFYFRNSSTNESDQVQEEVLRIDDLEFGSLLATNPLCRNDENGSIEIVGDNYNYSIFPKRGKKSGDKLFTNLRYGTYNITATDADGCQGTKTTRIYNPDTLVIRNLLTVSTTNIHCYGTLAADGFGGTKPLRYSIAPQVGKQTRNGIFEGLCTGNYTATVTDTNGCQVSEKFVIEADGEAPENIFDFVEIYPNPTQDKLTIKSNYLFEIETEILSTTGQKVAHNTWYEKEIELDLNNLPSGVYLLRLSTSIDEKIHKLVIEH